MIEILLILIFVILILILKKIEKFWHAFSLLNFSINKYEEIEELQKEVNKKQQFLKKLIDNCKIDPYRDPDCMITINGQKVSYDGYYGTIKQTLKMIEIYLEANRKFKSGISKKECHDYIVKRFKEEKI